MHSLLIIPLSIATVAYAQDSSVRGIVSNHEAVSSEPLTFEFTEPEQPDRERILSEADIANGRNEFDWMADYEVMDGLDLLDGEDEESWDSEDEFIYDDMEEDVEGDVEEFDSSYDSEDGMEFFPTQMEEFDEEEFDQEEELDFDEDEEGEGYDEIGAPMEFNEPIARRLRRVTPNAEQGEMDLDRDLAEKESLRDTTSPIFMPTEDENEEFELELEPEYLEELSSMELDHDDFDRNLNNGCFSNQKRIKVEIRTDNSGYETSWEIRRTNGGLITKGPPGQTKYADNARYIGGVCLGPGIYRFKVMDKFRDGMCGPRSGNGFYRMYINGSKKFTSPANCNIKWGQRTHTFTVRAPQQQQQQQQQPQQNNNVSAGRGGCTNVKVQFKVDKYGKETTVTLTGNGQTHLASRKDVGAYQTKTMQKCVPPGTYQLRLVDQDGICCRQGQGWYKLVANGQTIISGGYFVGSKTHTVKFGSNWQGQMSARDKEWLNAHNARRRKYNGGRGYVPLRWSRTLASDAKQYAERLGNNCNGQLVHAQGIQDGENLAKNSGSGAWGGQYAADEIMGRWVENELTWAYPRNAHYTQVVWRSTQYVGCGESVRNQGGNKMCRIQVCRYTRPGNCNVRNGNWRAEAWKDSTGCGRECPREGCYV